MKTLSDTPWVYIFTYRAGDDIPTFERSMPFYCLYRAKKWLVPRVGFLSVGCLPRRFYH